MRLQIGVDTRGFEMCRFGAFYQETPIGFCLTAFGKKYRGHRINCKDKVAVPATNFLISCIHTKGYGLIFIDYILIGQLQLTLRYFSKK